MPVMSSSVNSEKITSATLSFKLKMAGIILFIAFGITSCGGNTLQETEISVGGNPITVEIASTAEERAVGLMNRSSMPDDRGMLFVFETEHQASFWMKNTLIPLSIAFIAADGTIRQIEDMEPESLDSVTSRRNILYALEVNQGWFEARNIRTGDFVIIPPDLR